MKKEYQIPTRGSYNWLQKLFKMMKLTFALVLFSSMLVSAGVYSQDTKLSLDYKNVTIGELLQLIENQTEFRFAYSMSSLDPNERIIINVKDENIDQILEEILDKNQLTYQILDRYIVISDKKVVGKNQLTQQQLKVTGRVTDSSATPLPGVTVVIKGTTRGIVTDFDGNYTLLNVPVNASLVFSFVGMKTQEVEVAGNSVVNVILDEESIGLDEVVAIGYGTMKKSDITGSVASIKSESLQQLPSSRVDQVLQGRLSGVMVQNNSAAPNSKVSIRIRGANSINGGNDPLVVVDGFQGESLNTVNPSDIESIEVLKDASATAIYGSRGANGVILVTTKSGKKGKAIIGYDTYFSINQPRKKIDVMDAEQYAKVVNENRQEFGLNPIFSESKLAEFRLTGGTNWQDEILRTSFSHNHLLSIRGGDDNLSYYISGGFVNNDGIMKNSSYNRYTLRSNLVSKVTDKLKVNLNIYLSREKDNPTNLNSYGSNALSGNNGASAIFSALVFAPTKPIYVENGDYSMPGGGVGPPTNYNPVALVNEPIRDFYKNTTSVNAGIEYNITSDLKIDISGGYRLVDSENNEYYNSKPTKASRSEAASITDGRSVILQNTNLITYKKVINDVHSISVIGGYEQQFEQSNTNVAASKGFFTDAVTYNNLGLGSSPQIPSSAKATRTLQSFMSRANYSYDNKYLLTLTARADGSSVFGDNNKWGYFPSAAVGWNVSNESFMEGAKDVISQLKLRGSFGITGNQAIQPYQSLGLLNTNSPFPIDGVSLSTGATLGGIGNPDLEWEKTTQIDVGADFKFFEGRIELVADYYNKNTKDLLLLVPLPKASGGKAQVLRNVGEVENKGFELYVGGKPINSKVIWETGLTFGKNKNEVVALRGDETRYPLGDAGLPGFTNATWLEVGQPIGLYKGYEQAGVWKTSEATQAAVYGAFPGAPKFVDQNNDDEINSDDIVPIGNAQPDFTYGWTNRFSYKNLDLNVFIQGVYGNDVLNLSRVRMEITSGDSDATSPKILDRWTPQNENTDVPSFTGQQAFTTLSTSRWVEDGSYLRVKEISLGYNLPASLLMKLKVNSARIYVAGTNLFTVTDYSGFDPEASSSVDTRGGVDVASYPSQKIITFGLNLKF